MLPFTLGGKKIIRWYKYKCKNGILKIKTYRFLGYRVFFKIIKSIKNLNENCIEKIYNVKFIQQQ